MSKGKVTLDIAIGKATGCMQLGKTTFSATVRAVKGEDSMVVFHASDVVTPEREMAAWDRVIGGAGAAFVKMEEIFQCKTSAATTIDLKGNYTPSLVAKMKEAGFAGTETM